MYRGVGHVQRNNFVAHMNYGVSGARGETSLWRPLVVKSWTTTQEIQMNLGANYDKPDISSSTRAPTSLGLPNDVDQRFESAYLKESVSLVLFHK